MNPNVFKKRVYITGVLVMGIALFFLYKLFSLHFTGKIKIGDDRASELRRGRIRDRAGNILAISIEKYSLFANPEEVEDPEKTARALSPILGYSEDYLVEKIGKRNRRFAWVKRRLDDTAVKRIRELNLKGLYFRKEFQRAYPYGPLASNVVGFVGVDNRGLEGIEYRFESVLSGLPGASPWMDDLRGGSDVVLTLDRFIQYTAEAEIESAVRRSNAKQGAVVILEVRSGRILAIAKYPSCDPNRYYEYTPEQRRNFTVVDSFEPGSTLKIMALVALLESQKDALDREYRCEEKIEVADTEIKCTGRHGKVDLPAIIRYSCNIGMIQAMKRVRADSYYQVLRRFGFGERASELPGESEGFLRPLKEWSGLSKYSLSLGQEISVTSLQMVAAFGAIANGGVYMVPTVVESVRREDGPPVQVFYPRTKGRVLKKEIAGSIIRMMRGVVHGGTGTKAGITYYDVFGKTGTAQKSMKKGGYYADKYIASFVGAAPMEDPDLCMLVVIDEPRGNNSGGEIAAPVFAKIAMRILPYRGVKGSALPAREPRPMRHSLPEFDGLRMPDFHGMSPGDSLRMLVSMQKGRNISYTLEGTGRVYRQVPEAGAKLERDRKVLLYYRER